MTIDNVRDVFSGHGVYTLSFFVLPLQVSDHIV